MAMMWLAITTWLALVISTAWGFQYYKRKSYEGVNRHYVNVVDDTFRSINMSVGRIEREQETLAKNQMQLSALFVSLTDALITLGRTPVEPLPHTPRAKKEININDFILNMEYVRDKFAASPKEKEVVETIIGNIKKKYGRNNSASAA
jgi:hypothetical protein